VTQLDNAVAGQRDGVYSAIESVVTDHLPPRSRQAAGASRKDAIARRVAQLKDRIAKPSARQAASETLWLTSARVSTMTPGTAAEAAADRPGDHDLLDT